LRKKNLPVFHFPLVILRLSFAIAHSPSRRGANQAMTNDIYKNRRRLSRVGCDKASLEIACNSIVTRSAFFERRQHDNNIEKYQTANIVL
jgi:hypothetical protein